MGLAGGRCLIGGCSPDKLEEGFKEMKEKISRVLIKVILLKI